MPKLAPLFQQKTMPLCRASSCLPLLAKQGPSLPVLHFVPTPPSAVPFGRAPLQQFSNYKRLGFFLAPSLCICELVRLPARARRPSQLLSVLRCHRYGIISTFP